jgi:ribosomal protein S6
MNIINNFKNLNLSSSQESALEKLEFFLGSADQIFMLKGYAGSGKTTILKGLIKYLQEQKRDVLVMAPTGRAAKVLKDKTGEGATIHRCIYDTFNIDTIRSDSEDVAEQSFSFSFPIIENSNDNRILIIDEASMVSNVISSHELFTYGTGIVLEDLLTYAKIQTTKNKIIFVGDPAQLPPVQEKTSTAFDVEFFKSLGLGVDKVEMTDVFRQQGSGDINLLLDNATQIRNVLNSTPRMQLTLSFDQITSIRYKAEDVSSKFVELFPVPELDNGVIITYTNALAHAYNKSIREKLFPGHKEIVPGDIILINNNNYRHEVELYNGDMAKVIKVFPEIETVSAPVMVNEGGLRVRKVVTLTLRKIIIKVNGFDNEIECSIFDSLLNSSQRDLSVDEIKAIYINFVMRFNERQKLNKEQGLPHFKVGSKEFKSLLRTDGLINALRVKYGYAITCHKSQGGEWHTTFVDYYGKVGLKDSQLRWCYTAATRASHVCYSINPPDFGHFSKFEINPISALGIFPDDSLSFDGIMTSPFHKTTDHPAKSMKYWEIKEKLKNSPYQIVGIETLGPYLERYTINRDKEVYHIQANHNKAGLFENFRAVHPSVNYEVVLTLVNSQYETAYNINYSPSAPQLAKLFSAMQDSCEEVNGTITNIKEFIDKYYVIYYLKTSGKGSYIQFYFKQSGQLTKALPKSDLGIQDEKLVLLINKLSTHAI